MRRDGTKLFLEFDRGRSTKLVMVGGPKCKIW